MTCFGLVVLRLGFPASVAEFAYSKLPCATSHGSGALFWAMMFFPGGSKGGKGLGKGPSSPTQMEMGNVPITPSTPSTVTRQGQGMVPGQQGVSGIGVEGVGNGFQVAMGNGFGMMPQVPLIPGGGPSRFQPQNPGLSGPQGGMAVGGLTPQMQNVQQVLGLAQGLSNQQLMSLIQGSTRASAVSRANESLKFWSSAFWVTCGSRCTTEFWRKFRSGWWFRI